MKAPDGTLPTRNDVSMAFFDERKKLLPQKKPRALEAHEALMASWREDLRGLQGPALLDALERWREEQRAAALAASLPEVEAVHRTALAIADRFHPRGAWR